MFNPQNLLIKEICIKLDFRNEMINDVFTYSDIFSASNTHNFSNDVNYFIL